MDETVLEEGEDCSNHDSTIDLDVTLIDEKLQHVLGHFQKDFEGEVSHENLGPKFGGYGSFLPSYPRTLPEVYSGPKFLELLRSEGTCNSSMGLSSASPSGRPGSVSVTSASVDHDGSCDSMNKNIQSPVKDKIPNSYSDGVDKKDTKMRNKGETDNSGPSKKVEMNDQTQIFRSSSGWVSMPTLSVDSANSRANDRTQIFRSGSGWVSMSTLSVDSANSDGANSRARKATADEETMVGFEDDARIIIEQLTSLKKQLDVISIVGMPGLGKTTLARKVYNNPFIAYHFHASGWIHVSQVYQTRDLLLGILGSLVKYEYQIRHMWDEEEFGEQKLGEALYRHLTGQRYLIVIDDIWNLECWNFLKKYFPKENNGSRVLLTTQLVNVALQIKPDSRPHRLRFLTQNECWVLLEQKAFLGERCPLELVEIGKQIAASCQGLPLAIVAVAGILAKSEKTQTFWEQFAKRVSSYLVGDVQNFMGILEMSYWNLPPQLKPCFLYFGTSPLGHEFSIRTLTSLWIAEEFIQENEMQSLENVAEDYLMDLIERSLVIPTKKGCDGKTKACCVHGMLHELCKRHANECNFYHGIDQHESAYSSGSIPCNYPHFFSDSESLRCISGEASVSCSQSFCSDNHLNRMLGKAFSNSPRALDLSNVTLKEFPSDIVKQVHLRYLALRLYNVYKLPRSISNLCSLETLIIYRNRGCVTLPDTVWKLKMLRHLCIKPLMDFEPLNCGCHSVSDNLLTISTLRLSVYSEDVLAKTPNLRKLALLIPFLGFESFTFPDLTNLFHLETLKLVDWSVRSPKIGISMWSKFPHNLKKLTLSRGHLDWNEANFIGMLPNLEDLKLKHNPFKGTRWETSDGGFSQLRFLKLEAMDLKEWKASSDHFPLLQKLVLDRCRHLKEIPSSLGHIPTIQTMEVHWSSSSAADSVRKIEEEQQNLGNDGLKIFIYPAIKIQ